jgi:hypothetical protein
MYTMDSRLRASFEARRVVSFLNVSLPIRRGGAPSGAAAIIVPDEYFGNNLRIISEYYIFHWKDSKKKRNTFLLYFTDSALPKSDTTQTDNTALS